MRHLRSFVAPIVMGLVLPLVIVRAERGSVQRGLVSAPAGLVLLGSAISIIGLSVVIATIRLFVRLGDGTIMPWDPTRNLVVVCLYRHVRNPMILGVFAVEVGAAIAFASPGIAVLAAFFFALNTVYFIYSEEPGLEKRFGQAYVEYKQNVPRWFPRLSPWQPRSWWSARRDGSATEAGGVAPAMRSGGPVRWSRAPWWERVASMSP